MHLLEFYLGFRLHHNPCFNLFILHSNPFDNQGSEINKNDIFLSFDILSFTKTFLQKEREIDFLKPSSQRIKVLMDHFDLLIYIKKTYNRYSIFTFILSISFFGVKFSLPYFRIYQFFRIFSLYEP